MILSKVFFTTFTSGVDKLRKPLIKSLYTMKKQVFAFSTSSNVVSNAEKIVKHLPNVQSIKVWSLQGLILSSSNNYKAGNSQNIQKVTFKQIENLLTKISRDSKDSLHVVINKHFSTLQNVSRTQKDQSVDPQQQNNKALYKKLIEHINESQKWSFLPHYQNIANRQKQSNQRQLKLLIGDYNESMIEHFSPNSYVTLQQLCAMYPQKVPLSYRKRQTIQSIRQSISKRLSQGQQQKINFNQQPRFNEIIVINDRIKMWDEAYQIMLDQLPIKITVPFHSIEPSQKFHRLNLHNFIQGFRTCHRIIHPEIPLEIEQQNLQQFFTEHLKNLLKDSPARIPKVQVQVMDQSLSSHSGKRFQILF